MLGDILGGAAGLIQAITGIGTNIRANDIAQQTADLEEEQFDWQKEQAQEDWLFKQGQWKWQTDQALEDRAILERNRQSEHIRQDNAVQRRVADLKAAGLSPVLAAGSAAQTMAPVRPNTNASSPGSKQIPSRSLQGQMQKLQVMQNMQSASAQFSRTMSEVALLQAQKNKLDADADKVKVETENMIELHPSKLMIAGEVLRHNSVMNKFFEADKEKTTKLLSMEYMSYYDFWNWMNENFGGSERTRDGRLILRTGYGQQLINEFTAREKDLVFKEYQNAKEEYNQKYYKDRVWPIGQIPDWKKDVVGELKKAVRSRFGTGSWKGSFNNESLGGSSTYNNLGSKGLEDLTSNDILKLLND